MKCKCGCGKDINILSWHKYHPVSFIVGHHKRKQKERISCDFCGKHLLRHKLYISKLSHQYCSKKCCGNHKKFLNIKECCVCHKKFHRKGRRYLRNPTHKIFCSNTCSAIFFSGSNHPNFSGGIHKTGNGYLSIIDKDHFGGDDRNRNALHRYVMENHIGRKLSKSEVVHHIDGNKLNNNISNLKILSRKEHLIIHAKERVRSVIKKCLSCNKEFSVYPCLIKRSKFCCMECYLNYVKNVGQKW